MSNKIINPAPQEFQNRMRRLGWGSWVPTPGVTDEDREFYLTLGDTHIHVMSIAEAMTLSDEELFRRMEEKAGMSIEEMCERYGVEESQ